MRVLIAGGTGFMGAALTQRLGSSGHEVWALTRRVPRGSKQIRWDGFSREGWAEQIGDFDAIVNATGYGLEHWPWTARRKQEFIDSRVLPAAALTAAVGAAKRRPKVFVQISGINYYGLRGDAPADESSPPAPDFLAQLAVRWEAASEPIESLGVRRIVTRSAVVLDAGGGLLPLMALPVRLWVGGPLGDGMQAVPWIHVEDEVRAIEHLLENERATGAFNLIAPEGVSNAEFMRAVAHALGRPYWFRTPKLLLKLALGEMGALVLDGRHAIPKRLKEIGFEFKYPTLEIAIEHLFRQGKMQG